MNIGYTHVGDDKIVACRGTELKDLVGLYSLGMLMFHSKSAFFYYTILAELPKLAFTIFHTVALPNILYQSIHLRYIHIISHMYICCEHSMQHIKASLNNITLWEKGVQ